MRDLVHLVPDHRLATGHDEPACTISVLHRLNLCARATTTRRARSYFQMAPSLHPLAAGCVVRTSALPTSGPPWMTHGRRLGGPLPGHLIQWMRRYDWASAAGASRSKPTCSLSWSNSERSSAS